MDRRSIGVIVNPIAGMGGRVGLKGTDGAEALARARALGATPASHARAVRALAKLAPIADAFRLLACPGAMGADACREAGLDPETLPVAVTDETSGEHTRAAASAMAARRVDLLLFAGGDGTARDVLDGIGEDVPMLGIPTGVKMHSAVFAASPEAAGNLARLLAEGDARVRFREAEVMDLDEAGLRENRVSARLHGVARAPFERALMQAGKASAQASDEDALDAFARAFAARMEPGRLYVLGCGTTLRRIKRAIGFEGTLLGVDVVIDGRALALDVGEERLMRLVAGARATIVVGVTGGQGFVFGRGNQQIGPEVIRAVGRENIVVVTGVSKLVGLDPPVLRVDTGDPALDRDLAGYIRVETAPGQSTMMRIAA
ncbi:ATP-NAD kinase family protein [Salinarimonas ramus]|uniref:ATP-NAD kinase n=1 Tax=Salinarimonas ramus TaxID=690164 RepID=A0A917V889_9HYPH|nr:ATP-NAD kinase family protein [Salinarimonas ramus]GGK50742.1 ATP-NAD kinase [Salinarimonas ramus]